MSSSFEKIIHATDKRLSKYPVLRELEKKLKIPKVYFVFAVLLAITLSVVLILSKSFVFSLVSVLYPAYASLRVIESESKAEVEQWLSYWVILGLLTVFENFPGSPVGWIPLYGALKTGFVFYLFLPQYRGATLIYRRFMKKLLLSQMKYIDQFFERVRKISAEEDARSPNFKR